MKWLKLERSFWLLLVAGVVLRCLALRQPLLDAHLTRQCQTAAATESLIEAPGFDLSSKIPWAGDRNVRYLQELPLYNYLVMAVHHLIGNLDVSGGGVRVVPRSALRLFALLGDIPSYVTGNPFLINSSRFRSMTTPYETPVGRTFDLLGENPYTLEEGIRETVEWLRTYRGDDNAAVAGGL